MLRGPFSTARLRAPAGLSLLLAAAFSHAAAAADVVEIYVSPQGNDAWTGSRPNATPAGDDGPLATLAHARDVARARRAAGGDSPAAVTIWLRGGAYYLDKTLTLTSDDSGTAQAPVTWRAMPGEQPTISGGRPISGWTATEINGLTAWRASLPPGAGPAEIRELWCNDQRLERTRWPHQATLAVAHLPPGLQQGELTPGGSAFGYAAGDEPPVDTNPAGAEAIVCSLWSESHLPLSAIDRTARVWQAAAPATFRIAVDDRYWIENLRTTLREPGSFWFDAASRTIYLIPPAGVDLNTALVIAPQLDRVVRLAGDRERGRPVEYVSLVGLQFSHCEWFFNRPALPATATQQEIENAFATAGDRRTGFGQAAIGVPGAVEATLVRHCQWTDCRFDHLGTYGLELGRGCRDNEVRRCRFTDLGAGGVKLGEEAVRSDEIDQSADNRVSDCLVADGGNLFPGCVGIWVGQAHDNVIEHNEIRELWYTGVSFGWTWGYGPASGQRNRLENNHIHHIGAKRDGDRPLLSDMGGIYTLGDQTGTLIRNNLFHDIVGFRYGGWGIYFDEGTSHITAEHNLVYRTTHGGLHQHYGRENLVRNNIFAFGRDVQIQRSRVEPHLSFSFFDNVVLWSQGAALGGSWTELEIASDRNTWWRTDGGEFDFAGRSRAQWQAAGMDQNSKFADPRFADPQHGDFAATAASAAAFAGFQPFDLSNVGPRPAPTE
jgi:hypothetical protein